jgi:hypothetical protein
MGGFEMIKIAHMFQKLQPTKNTIVVDTTSKSGQWSELSPFLLGPCPLYGTYVSLNMENGWQYAKVYEQYTYVCKTSLPYGVEPSTNYWKWATTGWSDKVAHRFPMGKGEKPLFSLWDGNKLSYIDARKQIYVPLYARAVVEKSAYIELQKLLVEGKDLVLRDWDGYDHTGVTLSQVLNNPQRKMGHAFVLEMLLTQDEALAECGI